jgi:signal transduction histidine kinase
MNFRYRFTAGFIVISAAIFAIAAVVTIQTVKSNEEATLVEATSEESSKNADLITGVVSVFNADGALVGAPAESATSVGFENLVMSTLMQSSSIVKLSLYDVDGSLLWSSASGASAAIEPDLNSFAGAASGQTATGLSKDVAFVSNSGSVKTGDLTSTYIPLVDPSTQEPSQILEVSREVTDVLDGRIETAQSSMLRTLFSTLGASFAVLLGVVVSADTLLHRSRRRSLEQERILAESNVAAERLELRNQQLQQINEERDKFLSMVSHELRTPLTSMLAFTEVLRRRQEGSNKDANIDHLNLMRRNGDHLNSLIEELLEVTQLHAENFEIVKEQFDLQGLMADVKKSAASMVEARRQTLVVSELPGDAELNADRKRISQLLMNLVSNASLYSPTGTTISIDVELQGNLSKITVTDEGSGISQEDCEHLFDQFFRGNNEVTRSQSGLGLGLPIVKAIVDAHHGKVSVRSKVGEGTVVTVLLPLMETAEAEKVATAV